MIERLTPRELEILEFAAKGLSDKEISAQLGIHFGTVSTYWNRIRAKIDAPTRGAIIAKLVRHQITEGAGLHLVSLSDVGSLFESSGEMTRVEDILAIIPDPIARTDLGHRITYSNEAFKIRFNALVVDAGETRPRFSALMEQHLDEVIACGTAQSTNLAFESQEGRQVFEVRSVPELGMERRIRSVLSLMRQKGT